MSSSGPWDICYFTTWAYDVSTNSYQIGPVITITPTYVVVDGVTIEVTCAGMMVWWYGASGGGNGSNGLLEIAYSQVFNAYTFSGTYWMAGSPPPPGTNLYGFATQPSAPLSYWNGTYHCYQIFGGNIQEIGEIVIASPAVLWNRNSVNNPIYTGLSANGTDTAELAWFTSDGNPNNVAISFFVGTSSPDNGVQVFSGNIWPDGKTRPEGAPSSVNNFFGTTQTTEEAVLVDQLANMAQAAVNVGMHLAEVDAEGGAGGPGAADGDDAADDAVDAAGDDVVDAAGDDAADQAVGRVAVDVGEDAAADLAEAIGG